MLRRGFKQFEHVGRCKSKLLPLGLTYAKAVVRERDNQVGPQPRGIHWAMTHPTQTYRITIVWSHVNLSVVTIVILIII